MPFAERKLHIVGEILAVTLLAPYLIYLSTQIKTYHKYILVLIVILTWIIDGYLLYKYQDWYN